MFSKKTTGPAQPVARQVSNRNMANPTFSILASDTSITGNIVSASDLHIDGKVEGDIHCAALVQGETSEITGAILANSAKLAGLVNGTIEAAELVVLKTARIVGDVAYDTLSIEPGAKVEGRLISRDSAAHRAANDAGSQGFEPYSVEDNSAPALALDA